MSPSTPTDPTLNTHVAQQMEPTVEAAEIALRAVDELAERAAQIEHLQAELDALRADLAKGQDALLRKAAEFENYRRRTQAELVGATAQGRAEVVLALLDVYDDLRRSLKAATDVAAQDDAPASAAFQSLTQGVELVYRKFSDELARLGVEALEATGKPFSEAEHEALLQQEVSGDIAPGTVLAEVLRGYRMGDRVLRHARVIVAK